MIENVDDALDERAQQEAERELAQDAQKFMAVIDFGLQVSQFLAGPIGKRLMADADDERATLLTEYMALNPDNKGDRPRMRDIRHRLGVLEHWQECFAQYIQAGVDAEEQIHNIDGPLTASG